MRLLLGLWLMAACASRPEPVATQTESRGLSKSGRKPVEECRLDGDWVLDEMVRAVVDPQDRPIHAVEVRVLAWQISHLDDGKPLHQAVLWMRLQKRYIVANVSRYPATTDTRWRGTHIMQSSSDVMSSIPPWREYELPPTEAEVEAFLRTRTWYGQQPVAGQVCDPLVQGPHPRVGK